MGEFAEPREVKMEKRSKLSVFIFILLLISSLSAVETAKKWSFAVEAGSVFANSNTVQV